MADLHCCQVEDVASYRCGNCSKTYSTICQLCKHLINYKSRGSFYFNDTSKVGYPKYDFASKETQTDMSFDNETDLKVLFLLQKHKQKMYPIILGIEDGFDEISTGMNLFAEREINEPETHNAISVQATRQKSMAKKRKEKQNYNTQNVVKEVSLKKSAELNLKILQLGHNRRLSRKCKDHVKFRLRSVEPNTDDLRKLRKRNNSYTGQVLTDSYTEIEELDMIKVKGVKLKSNAKAKKKKVTFSKANNASKASSENTISTSNKFEVQRTKCSSSFQKSDNKKQGVVKVTKTWMPAHDVPDRIQPVAETYPAHDDLYENSEQETLMPENDDVDRVQKVSKPNLIDDAHVTIEQEILAPASDVVDRIQQLVAESYPPHHLHETSTQEELRPNIDVMDRGHKHVAESYPAHQFDETSTTDHLHAEQIPQHLNLDTSDKSHKLHAQNSRKLKNITECEVCGKTIGKYNYKDHLNTHFNRTPFVCELCGKSLTSRKALGMHRLYSHIEDSVKKRCKFCDKKFPTKTRLEDHMATHTKDKEFVCVKCGKVFFSKHSLRRHIVRVHEETKVFHKCTKCDKKFKTRPHLREHVMSHSQVFTCETCGASFNRLSSKRRHEQTHTGSRNHKCHICAHQFIQKTPYWVHMEKHHDLTREQLSEMFPLQHGGGRKYTVPESISQLEIQTHMAEDEDDMTEENE